MIRISCHCKHVLEVPADQAGRTAQCPACGRLVDIPNMGDLDVIEKDGTYKLDTPPLAPNPTDFDTLSIVYYPGHKTKSGAEIDLRGTVPPPAEIPLANPNPDAPTPGSPKYDPTTGELIEPFSLGQTHLSDVHPATLPVATRLLSYNSQSNAMDGIPHGWSIFSALFLPHNMMVMFGIFLFHLFIILSSVVTYFLVMFIVAPLVALMAIMGHYAVVVEEIGPAERDDLPRPLGDCQFYDDFWSPFCHFAGSLILCYWPAGLIFFPNDAAALAGRPLPFPNPLIPLLVMMIVGSFFFPVTLLTLGCSGSLRNLRPDRVLGTIRSIGLTYIPLVLLWIFASTIYLTGQVGLIAIFGNATWLTAAAASTTTLAAAIYLMHAFCWLLGMEYRKHQPEFPWVLQRHLAKPTAVIRPMLHPKLQAAEQATQHRAAARAKLKVR